MLKMLLPTIFPTAMSRSPRRSATIAVASSGSEVPRATTVSPKTSPLTPNEEAMPTAPFTKNCEPSTSSPIPVSRATPASHSGTGFAPKGARQGWSSGDLPPDAPAQG